MIEAHTFGSKAENTLPEYELNCKKMKEKEYG
jgi:hypothetical protein